MTNKEESKERARSIKFLFKKIADLRKEMDEYVYLAEMICTIEEWNFHNYGYKK